MSKINFRVLAKIKARLISSPFAYLAFEVNAFAIYAKMMLSGTSGKYSNTTFVISPYKTGTLYLCNGYDPKVARHQPLQHLTLKKLNRNFSSFFKRRMNYLNIPLECSGFWAGFIDELTADPMAKQLKYICILRLPSSWISSVISYWLLCDYLGYDSINEYFWKKRVGVDLRHFGRRSQASQEEVINRLFDFYMDFTRKTKKLPNVSYIKIGELEKKASLIDSIVGVKSSLDRTERNSNLKKDFIYVNEDFDKSYTDLISNLPIG